jgi:hypothetical protein
MTSSTHDSQLGISFVFSTLITGGGTRLSHYVSIERPICVKMALVCESCQGDLRGQELAPNCSLQSAVNLFDGATRYVGRFLIRGSLGASTERRQVCMNLTMEGWDHAYVCYRPREPQSLIVHLHQQMNDGDDYSAQKVAQEHIHRQLWIMRNRAPVNTCADESDEDAPSNRSKYLGGVRFRQSDCSFRIKQHVRIWDYDDLAVPTFRTSALPCRRSNL